MSLEAELRRDTNPTPTRFLLECGAFTPGFGLDNYNPFDASLTFLNTGTPKAELNPFDTSFKTPSTAISVVNNTNSTLQAHQEATKRQQQRGAERHPWSDIMLDDMAMPMPQMSPGLSPASSSFSSASPSPPIASPPPSNFSRDQYHPSTTIPPHATYEHSPIFVDATPSKRPVHHREHSPRYLSPVSSDSYTYSQHTHESRQQASQQLKDSRFLDNPLICEEQVHYQNQQQFSPQDREDEEDGDDEHEMDMMAGDSGVDDAMSALRMRRQSHASSTSNSSEPSSSSLSPIDRDPQPSTIELGVTAKSKKTGQATGRKAGQKRSRGQDESPEAKRQKFLERNRMAASKCREKKRLKTLKTISDADEITSRNQALHETLDELQEEVRLLKNQILCHRDCSCDVIQKFVLSSFDTTSRNSHSSSRNNSISSIGDNYPSAFTSSMHVFQDMIPVEPMHF
ncbi:hypothetical protein BGZ96_003559 [Linnemannia gamsii]|uniref:BZIP domain-containing protein n=1 Tax=Linnemannia gamsii TaxID=64522 RepID=A0ABQ7K9M5_9FUNG|nr:hypothetical protein BGZ96_003559 [Linnemannia gamsii]